MEPRGRERHRSGKPRGRSGREHQTERQASKVGGASETWRILCWRQIVSATALITFGQERYYVSAFPPRQWLKLVAGDILPGSE